MSQQEETTQLSALNTQLKDLTEENEALFEQLHVVQEELEKYYHKLKECEQRKGTTAGVSNPEELLEVLTEKIRLQKTVKVQQDLLRIEITNSLAARLGNMLIQGTSSMGALLGLPGKLRKFWRATEQTTPPAILGGKDFGKVLEAHSKGGRQAVEKLLDSVFLAPNMRANAYTALARHLMSLDVKKAAEFARLAYETDPRPYRLKWLAFRMHDVDDALAAEAMLALLPDDIKMSDSEQRQVGQIRNDAARQSKSAVQTDMHYKERKSTVDKKLAELSKKAEEHQKAADILRTKHDELQKLAEERKHEGDILRAKHGELQKLADDRKHEGDILREKQQELQKLAEERKHECDIQRTKYEELQRHYQQDTKQATEQLNGIQAALAQQGSSLSSHMTKQQSELERLRKTMGRGLNAELDVQLQQIVAYNGLSEYFTNGKLPEVTPWKRGWPASPDYILWLVELLHTNDYDLILEFGSGISTLFTAKTLAARARHNPSAKIGAVVTFEHLEQYAEQTRGLLQHAGLADYAKVVHAPLQDYAAPNGTIYPYYSCKEALEGLSAQFRGHTSRILVIVDGPPGSTGIHARYPAFPTVMKFFAGARIDFLLDDYIRGDEKEIARLWEAACGTAGLEYAVVEKQLEKEAFLMSISPAGMGGEA